MSALEFAQVSSPATVAEPTETPEPQPVPTPAPSVPEPEPESAPSISEPEPAPAPAPLDSVSITPVEVAAGENQQLEVVATDKEGNHLSEYDIAWKIIDEGAGSVTEDGLFTAGEVAQSYADAVEVKVTKGDMIRIAVASVTITPGPLEQVVIAPDPAEIGIGMTQQFVAVRTDRYGNRISDLAFSWSVENGGGTIDETGLFTAGAVSGNYADTVKVEATQEIVTRSAMADVTVEPDRILFMSEKQMYLMDDDGSNVRSLVSAKEKEFEFSCSPDGHRIAYYTGDTDGKIMVMSIDGSDKLCLLENDSDITHSFPVWSPDSARLLFTSYSEKDGNSDIYVIDADGSNLTLLTDTSNYDESTPLWSPDGTRIMYQISRRIWIMNADGSDQKSLLSIRVYYPEWSPDGTQIAFASKDNEGYRDIYVIDAYSGNLTQLTDTSKIHEYYPEWSPDGTRIMYLVEESGYRIYRDIYVDLDIYGIVYVINADGSNQRRLARQTGSVMWSPDSTQIVFSSDADGDFEIYVLDADGTNRHNLTSDKPLYINFKGSAYHCEDVDPVWSPDGSKIVFARSSETKNLLYSDMDFGIWVMDADGSDKTCLTANEDDDVHPQWVPRMRGVEVNEESVTIPVPVP